MIHIPETELILLSLFQSHQEGYRPGINRIVLQSPVITDHGGIHGRILGKMDIFPCPAAALNGYGIIAEELAKHLYCLYTHSLRRPLGHLTHRSVDPAVAVLLIEDLCP